MVKKTQFNTVVHADTQIDNIDSMHRFGVYDDRIWYLYVGQESTTYKGIIYTQPKDTISGIAATNVASFETEATYTTLTSCMFKCTSTGLMCAVMTATDGGTNYNRVCYYSIDGGVNWTRKSYVTTTATWSAIRIAMINFNLDDDAINICWTSTNVADSLVYLRYTLAVYFGVSTYDQSFTTGTYNSMRMTGLEDIYMDSRNIPDPDNAGQYLVSFATVPSTDATKLIFMSFGFSATGGGSSSSARSTITNYTKPASMDIDRQALEYDISDYSFMIMDSTQVVQSYEDSSTISLRIVATTYDQHAIMWDEDYIFTYFCFDGIVYVDWGLPYIPIQNLGVEIYSACYIYLFKVGRDVYAKSIITSTDLIRCELKTTKELERSAMIVSNTAFLDRQGYEIYNDSNVLQLKGMITETTEDVGQYSTILLDPAKRDLDRGITYQGSAQTISTALTAIFTTNNLCLTVGTFSTGATTRDYDYKDKPLRAILTELAHTEGMIWYYNGSWQVYINDGTTDSNIDILAADGQVPVTDRKFKRITIGKVELTVAGNVKCTKYATVGGSDIISDTYPNMTVAQGNELAQQLADKGAINILGYKISSLLIGQFDAGSQIDFEQNIKPHDQASAKFYVEYVVYDLIHNVLVEAEIMDALYLKLENKTQQLTNLVNHAVVTADAALPKAGGELTNSVIIDAEGNFKNQHADDWGTTGTPTTLTETMGASNSGTITTNAGHNYAVEITRGATAGQTAQYSKTFAAISLCYISQWIWSDDVTKRSNLYVDDGTRYFYLILEDDVVKYRTGGTTTITGIPILDNTPYHVLIYWDDTNDYVTAYLNGTQIIKVAIAGATGLTTWITESDMAYVSFKTYFDAVYIGTSKLKALSSFKDGMIVAKGLYTESIVADNIVEMNRPYAILKAITTAQTISNTTDTVIYWNGEVSDLSAMHSTSTDTHKVFCVRAGVYQITTTVTFAANNTGVRICYIQHFNAAGTAQEPTRMGDQYIQAVQTFDSIMTVSSTRKMNVGDYIVVLVYQSSGGDLTVLANPTSYQPTYFTMYYMGA